MHKKVEVRMNISKLEYFAAVSELSSFTKAAQKLHISQTAISQQIASLERELGVRLFDRTPTPITLTPAGAVFYREVKILLEHYSRAVSKARWKDQEKPVITIGYSSLFEIQLISEITLRFQTSHPDVQVVFIKKTLEELADALISGVCDIAFSMNCAFDRQKSRIRQYPVFAGSMLLGVSKDHPKAGRGTIEAKELREEKFLFLCEDSASVALHGMIENCRKDGFEPEVLERISSLETLILMVELNRGVAFFPNVGRFAEDSRIEYLTIANSPHQFLIVAGCLEQVTNPLAHEFLLIAAEAGPVSQSSI